MDISYLKRPVMVIYVGDPLISLWFDARSTLSMTETCLNPSDTPPPPSHLSPRPKQLYPRPATQFHSFTLRPCGHKTARPGGVDIRSFGFGRAMIFIRAPSDLDIDLVRFGTWCLRMPRQRQGHDSVSGSFSNN